MRGGERISEEDLAVGQRLASARTAANLTQSAAATELGFAQSRIAKLEIGTRRLLFSEAVDLADLYGVEIGDFVVPRASTDPGLTAAQRTGSRNAHGGRRTTRRSHST